LIVFEDDPAAALVQVLNLLAVHPEFRVIPAARPSQSRKFIQGIGAYLLGTIQTIWLYSRVKADQDNAALLRDFFDAEYYAGRYPEVRRSRIPLLGHYLFIGFRNGFDPSRLFDTSEYLAANRDVNASRVNPLLHYLVEGRKEGRLCVPPQGGIKHE
jgi:hypothetical protein